MRVVALDLDGTLLDCKERQSLLAATLCRAAGFELDIETFWNAKREGATTTSAICAQGVDERFAATLSKLWVDQIECDVWLRMDRLLPGVLYYLRDACEQRFQLHMLTARTNERALKRQLQWLSIAPFFHHVEVVCPQKASQQKAKYLKTVAPIIFVGDSESDAAAANSAKIKFLAVTNGQRSATYFQSRTNLSAKDIKADFPSAIKDIYDKNR